MQGSFDYYNAAPAYRNMLTYFSRCFAPETDPNNSFCYLAIMETKDGFLVAYYNCDNEIVPLRAGKVREVFYSEIEKAIAVVQERTVNANW